jgi:hypothetical protein
MNGKRRVTTSILTLTPVSTVEGEKKLRDCHAALAMTGGTHPPSPIKGEENYWVQRVLKGNGVK